MSSTKLSPAQIKSAVEAVRMVPSHTLPAKLTPLEAQVAQLRQSVPPHVVLLVMCGYKVKVFGRDSHVLSRRTGVMCVGAGVGDSAGVSSPFEYSSFPVQRMEYYASRLVSMGYVVGVVDQIETAAGREVGKDEGGGGKSVFERRLTRVLSPGTAFEFTGLLQGSPPKVSADEENDGAAEPLDDAAAPPPTTAGDHNIWFLFEGPGSVIEMLIVSIPTGSYARKTIDDPSLLVDAFKEVCMVYDPVEVVLGAPPSQAVSDLLQACFLGSLHWGPTRDGSEDGAKVPLIVCGSIKGASSVADVAKHHLTFMGVYDAYLLATEAPYLHRRPHTMLLPAPALNALEVFYGSYRHRTAQGSLFQFINRCQTTSGSRLMRRWVAAPLATMSHIADRRAAVDEVSDLDAAGEVTRMLAGIQGLDMEGSLSRLAAGRCGVGEYRSFLRRLTALKAGATALMATRGACSSAVLVEAVARLTGTALQEALVEEAPFQRAAPEGVVPTVEWLLLGDKSTPAPPSVLNCQREVEEAEAQLLHQLEAARSTLSLPTLAYKEVANVPYLLEIPIAVEKRVPSDWQLIGRIKGFSRYRTESITHLVNVRQRGLEKRAAAANEYFVNHQLRRYAPIGEGSSLRVPFAAAVNASATIDALLALGRLHGMAGFCRPELFEIGPSTNITGIILKGLAHPMQRCQRGDYVTCDFQSGEGVRAWVLTGPNMGGKSALMRSVALAALMAQVGAPVAATFARLPIFTSIHTRMGAQDELLAGNSTFMFEIKETNTILQAKDLSTSLVLMDELGRGTSSYDGMSVADSTLRFLCNRVGFLLFVTHYSTIAQQARGNPTIERRFMGFEHVPAADGTSKLVFLYQPVDGITPSSFGIDVAKLANLPSSVVDEARARSSAAEVSLLVRRAVKRMREDTRQ